MKKLTLFEAQKRKKRLVIALTLLFALTLCACSNVGSSIENYSWKMRIVQSNDIEVAQDVEQSVIAIGEQDDAYHNAPVVELILTAKDGTISVDDKTNNKAYEGTYLKQKFSSYGTIYEVVIDGESGYATASITKSDGVETPALSINLGNQSVLFYSISLE